MATPQATITRPPSTEYASYYEKYVSLVPESNIVGTLTAQREATLKLLDSIDDSQATTRYEPGKWSIKELLGHMIDTERIFNYRAMRFARNDTLPLTGFDQDDYVRAANFDQRPWSELKEEFEVVRQGTIQLFKSLSEEAWARRGTANDSEVSVRALAYIIAGHELHHVQVVKSRYL